MYVFWLAGSKPKALECRKFQRQEQGFRQLPQSCGGAGAGACLGKQPVRAGGAGAGSNCSLGW